MYEIASEGNSFGLIERPMDAEVNAALPVFFFSLGKCREASGTERADIALAVDRDTIELIRREGERQPVGAVEAPQRLEQRSAKRGVPRWVGWERRCEVGAGQVARRSSQRHEVHVSRRVRIPISQASRTSAGIRLADGNYRTPEIPVVLRIP